MTGRCVGLKKDRLDRSSMRGRKGAALVELALVLPLLSFMMVATTDFARAYHDFVIVTDRARSAALYASGNVGTPSTSVSDATWQAGVIASAMADKTELNSSTQVVISPTKLSAITAADPYVTVTVTSPFRTVMTYPGIPSQMTFSRTVRMRLQPTAYRMK